MLGRKLGASLAAARRQDGAAGAGAHAKAEAVLLGTTAVVRLERALAHGVLPWSGADRAASRVGRADGLDDVPHDGRGNLTTIRERRGAVNGASTAIAPRRMRDTGTCTGCAMRADSMNPRRGRC